LKSSVVRLKPMPGWDWNACGHDEIIPCLEVPLQLSGESAPFTHVKAEFREAWSITWVATLFLNLSTKELAIRVRKPLHKLRAEALIRRLNACMLLFGPRLGIMENHICLQEIESVQP
jgi:hypothetical protein